MISMSLLKTKNDINVYLRFVDHLLLGHANHDLNV